MIIFVGINDLNFVCIFGEGNFLYNLRFIFNVIVMFYNVIYMFGVRFVVVFILDRECEGLGICIKLKYIYKKIN